MTRRRKLMLNSASSLLYQLVTIICGFILPRFFLTYYGSEINGLISSITQFLGFISLAECGVGVVVQSTLYKPLADGDVITVSKIVISSERFFRRIAYILLVYSAILMVVYPLIVIDSFDYLFTLQLILVISIRTFAQYYLGMTYRLLLNADQMGFIQYTVYSIAQVVNIVACIELMRRGVSIQGVKLTTSLIFIIPPVLLSIIAKCRYKIKRRITFNEEPIKQKWNGLAQHIATVVLGNTDTIVLTLFSTLENVSIYAVYHLVVNGVKQIVVSMTNGIQAMFGNMIAKGETEELKHFFDCIEWLLHTLVTFVFSVTAILIVPFVQVYTASITDADYIVPVFAYMITLAQAAYCLRLPYNIMVLAAGHYKQTQLSAIIEATINIAISIVLVFRLGLIGVAIGTFVAMTYRTIYLAHYLKKNLLYREMRHFVKHILVDICSVLFLFTLISIFSSFFEMKQTNYFAWLVLAVKTGLTSGAILIFINGLFYRKKLKHYFMKINRLVNEHRMNFKKD